MTRRRLVVRGVIALGIAGLAVFVLYAAGRTRQKVRMTMCVHNLKVIGLRLRLYADEHDGAFPDTWSALVTHLEITDPDSLDDVFVCPELGGYHYRKRGRSHTVTGPDDIDECSSYVLVGGLHTTDDKDTILAYEKGDNHGGVGHSVLYIDGRGGWDPPGNWR